MFVFTALPIVASLATWLAPVSATIQPTCSNSTLSAFTIRALYTDPALNVGLPTDGISITSTLVDVDHLTWYSILTVRHFLRSGSSPF